MPCRQIPKQPMIPSRSGMGAWGMAVLCPSEVEPLRSAVESGLEYDLAFAGGDLFFFD